MNKLEVNMNKHKWFLVLIVMSVVALIGSAAGCAPAAPTGPADKPAIKSFAASPTSISQGQSTNLSWDVSGATTVTIEPAIGTVGSSGSLQLKPDASTTYTLTATNQAGTDTNSVSIAVTPVVAGKPDLVITDFWLMGSQVNYKIANLGNAESEPSQTYFYIGTMNENKQTTTWLKQGSGRVEPLAAGEERMTAFPNFDWKFETGINPFAEEELGYDVKVCVDAESAVAESNEDNNCLTRIWKQGFTYDFFQNAPLATWRSSAGATNLRWPMVTEDDNGAVVRNNFSPFMTICPEHASNGWILGRYGEIYGEYGKTMMRAFTIPQKVKFTAKVGFAPGVKSSDGVRFALGYVDDMGSIVFFPKMDVSSDGQMHDYEIDLSDMAGKKTEFLLLVEAKGSPDGDCVRVLEPKLTQEGSVGGM
jgi:hypothetical protein